MVGGDGEQDDDAGADPLKESIIAKSGGARSGSSGQYAL
jgi:hypothetical protein